ncbi:amino acid dehydrogenase [Echinicola strongylocentroti]|uniref:Amino acid dehydrogenase n=1 Tax=Echinicola strongylocentroti TaxID=1795355 RepID=A0A2Z4IEG5_9BACT|nr:FAD-dependent oxidoreductase [Echinicola strongylocentroti]AWW29245.1 amino acid dehydrogenase [Echinicola strongylocentroti]
MKPTVVIGGGVVGLFTAYFLQQQGEEVIVVDQGDMEENCSTGNAGMIVPSHIVPLASPGMISKGISWMFSSKSPFYIQPRLDRRLIDWCLQFYRHSNAKHVQQSIPYLKGISLYSKQLYLDFVAAHGNEAIKLQDRGLLMLYKTKEGEKDEAALAQLARENGLHADILSKEEIRTLEPNQEVDVRGGVYFPDDAHLSPKDLYRLLKNHLKDQGVTLKSNVTITGIEKGGSKVKAVITQEGKIDCDHLMVCAGAWSGEIAKMLGFRMPMMAGKGYSFELPNMPELKQASILTEARVSQSPYGDKVRFGGTMEISNHVDKINICRVEGIFESIKAYYPEFQAVFPSEDKIWKGMRPCSPDGLPYIGKAPGWENVAFGAGHSMMGVSLAPATGKILADLKTGKIGTLKTDAFAVGRYVR